MVPRSPNSPPSPPSPYAPPTSHAAASQNPDVDIADAMTPLSAKAGGGVVLFAGVIFTLMALQTFALVRMKGLWIVMPVLILLVGLSLVGAGVGLFRARGWSGLGALIVSGVAALLSLVWLVVTIASGIFGLFALAAPALALGGIVAGAVNMGPVRRVSDARARLSAGGLDFGL
jgi:hypothetical protein